MSDAYDQEIKLDIDMNRGHTQNFDTPIIENSTKTNKFNPIAFIIITILWLIAVIAEAFYRETIRNGISVDFMMYLQRNRKTVLDYVFLVFANLVHPYLIASSYILALIVGRDKWKVLNFISYSSIVTYILSLLKTIYGDPRPYFDHDEIKPLESYAEYGNPSGHSLFGYFFVAYVFEKWIFRCKLYITVHDEGYNKSNITDPNGSNIEFKSEKQGKIGVFSFIMMIFVVSGIIMSRLYLGMHSLD
jgi:membrane-associated phospholipid phosphatase